MCNKLQSLFHSLNFHRVWNNQNTPSIKCLTKAMLNKLKEKYIKYWKTCLTEDNDNFMNKLQCYKDLKKEYKLEQYLLTYIDKKYVSYFIKLRISNSKLMIEEGRFKNLRKEDRICPLCKSHIETETHFVIKCSELQDIRQTFFKKIREIIPMFNNMSDFDKFKLIMSSNDYDVNRVCIYGVGELYEKRLTLLR